MNGNWERFQFVPRFYQCSLACSGTIPFSLLAQLVVVNWGDWAKQVNEAGYLYWFLIDIIPQFSSTIEWRSEKNNDVSRLIATGTLTEQLISPGVFCVVIRLNYSACSNWEPYRLRVHTAMQVNHFRTFKTVL